LSALLTTASFLFTALSAARILFRALSMLSTVRFSCEASPSTASAAALRALHKGVIEKKNI